MMLISRSHARHTAARSSHLLAQLRQRGARNFPVMRRLRVELLSTKNRSLPRSNRNGNSSARCWRRHRLK